MATAKIEMAVSKLARFLSGAQIEIPMTPPEYLELNSLLEEEQELYLVSYGSYGILPSFDPDCLTAICWLRVCGIAFKVEDSNEPEMSPNGRLPFLMFSDGKTVKEEDIYEFGMKRSSKTELSPPPQPQTQVMLTALTLLQKSIRPALLAAIWLEEPMRSKVTKRNYSRNYPWPLCEYLIWKRRRAVQAEIPLLDKNGAAKLIADALESLRTLSELLGGGGSEYFSGPRPGYVDCVAYGLLAVALVTLPSSHVLRGMIETCSGLRALIGRMRREFFD